MKILKIILVIVVSMIIFVGCGKNENIENEKNVNDVNNEVKETTIETSKIIEESSVENEVQIKTANIINEFKIQKNKITFVNFWATWCGPCVMEMGDLQELYNEMKNNENVEMIFVNLGDTKNVVESFLNQNGYTIPVYCDENGVYGAEYNITAIPQTIIFDKYGDIIDTVVGANSKDVYKNVIEEATAK